MDPALLQQIAKKNKDLLDEGILNILMEVVEGSVNNKTPFAAEEMFTKFFDESALIMASIEKLTKETPIDFPKLREALHGLWAECVGVGALKMLKAVDNATQFAEEECIDKLKMALDTANAELRTLTTWLQPYFLLVRQIGQVPTVLKKTD